MKEIILKVIIIISYISTGAISVGHPAYAMTLNLVGATALAFLKAR